MTFIGRRPRFSAAIVPQMLTCFAPWVSPASFPLGSARWYPLPEYKCPSCSPPHERRASPWIEEREGRIEALDTQSVRDDGIDTLEPQLGPIFDWIEKARLEGGQGLVRCWAGVSRSAAVTAGSTWLFSVAPTRRWRSDRLSSETPWNPSRGRAPNCSFSTTQSRCNRT